jgi:hypothetical protein
LIDDRIASIDGSLRSFAIISAPSKPLYSPKSHG